VERGLFFRIGFARAFGPLLLSLVLCTRKLSGKYVAGINIATGTIREWNTMEGPPEGSDLVDPNNERSYVNYPTKPAIDVVKGYLSKFQSLEWISVHPDRESGICEGSEGAKVSWRTGQCHR
jgi:hypothetical protein